METVGLYLKKERESKNLSLGEVSRLTKISKSYLEHIENDEFDKLPQGPYAKGYIASYSRLIGGNADEAIKLYESLNCERAPTEAIQADTILDSSSNDLPEKPNTKVRKKPKGALLVKAKSLFDTVASSVRVNSASFKTAGTSIKTIGSSIRKKSNRFEINLAFFKKMASSGFWLYALMALLGSGIVVLAGFGFYHLFIYDPNPLSVAELQRLHEEKTRPLSAIGSEKSVSASTPTGATATTDQVIGHTSKKEPAKRIDPPEDQKRSSLPSTPSEPVTPRTTSIPKIASGTSKPAIQQASPPLSGSPPTPENAAPGLSVDGKENSLSLDQERTVTGSPPGTESADINLRVLRASVCSEIKDRMPAGVDTAFPISAERVYVWSEIEAKQIPSKIRHIYYFNGQKASDITLDVRSYYWRTWSSKSISEDSDRGGWRVDIAAADGKVLRRLYFEVR